MTHHPAVEAAVDRAAELLSQQIGLRQQSNLRGRLRRCIRDEAAANGEDVGAYVDMLTVRGGAMQTLFNHVTVQESGFFRHPEHFAVLARDILPGLTPPVTIWSAGCANGQEAYSLAMVLEELGIDGAVLATDLSTTARARTVAAHYTTRELGGLTPDRRDRYLTRVGRDWQINTHIRSRVSTVRHNLIQAPPERARGSQVVFCRNVLIYFAPEEARLFLARLADTIPAAWVFLGSAETIWSVSDRYQTVRAGDCYYYRRRPAVPAPAEPFGRDQLSAEPAQPRPTPPGSRFLPAGAPISDVLVPGLGRRGRTPVPPGRPAARIPATTASTADNGAAAFARAGQLALDAGDHRSAVVAFRKCAFLSPDDPLAHLHLGLAFEAAGDPWSARRAFATARRTVLTTASTEFRYDIGGYAPDELLRLLDTKWDGP
jgi:chemotaxis protein methyltransferase CheR